MPSAARVNIMLHASLRACLLGCLAAYWAPVKLHSDVSSTGVHLASGPMVQKMCVRHDFLRHWPATEALAPSRPSASKGQLPVGS